MFLVDRLPDASSEIDETGFRSLVRDGRRTDHVKLGDETRSAFLGPSPSRIEFSLALPREPGLRFGLGIASFEPGAGGPPVRFRVRVDDGGEGAVAFEETLRRRDEWVDRSVSLGEWSGREVRLVFETEWGASPDASTPPAALPLWGSPVVAPAEPTETARPHLFLISIDCLRADHLGAYGYEVEVSPNLDAFAADAVVYEQAVATSAWTLPTHMSMMTGLTPSFHGAVTPSSPVDDGVTLLAEHLRKSGYETSGLVTWWFVSQAYGFDRGFDRFALRTLATAEEVLDEALDRLRGGAAPEQFVFLHLLEPHWEYAPAPERLEALGPRPADVSRLLEMADQGSPDPTTKDVEEMVRLYDAEIATVDAALGRFFSELRTLGLYDDALIIVTADHGEAFFEHQGWQHDTLYQEVLHVPLIVKYPRGEPGGAGSTLPPGRVSRPVSQAQVFATLLDQAGVELATAVVPGLESDVERPIISEYEVAAINRRHGRAPVPGTDRLVSVRLGSLKYVASLAPSEEGEAPEILAEELYDLAEDPSETRDLATERPRERESLHNVLRSYLRAAAAARRDGGRGTLPLEGEMLRDLESLGYVTPAPAGRPSPR